MENFRDYENSLNKLGLKSEAKDIKILEDIINNYNEKILVINAGLVKAGKSSLFNALISKQEYFETGAARKTVENKEYQFSESITIIDTPGLDSVYETDSEKAFSAYYKADIILFIHNINSGEFDKYEIDYLNMLKSKIPRGEFDKIIFIASHLDEKEDNELTEVVNKIKDQLFKIYNYDFEVIPVSAKRYFTGLEKGKDLLVNKSNILELKNLIVNKSSEFKSKKYSVKQERVNLLKSNITKKLESLKYETNSKILQKKSESNSKLNKLLKEIDNIFSAILNKLNIIKNYRG